ncbi:uncharacterized protein LOC123656208 [Melitaea cinxia]|uniref:uncharacterized protein LOC123656208 n=1 Tax=Melitaea cinxia TaxID=113334 RepID=UPI001E273E41|nr:uncharacterized protein LOC123656208 [Melitaea cinxia]
MYRQVQVNTDDRDLQLVIWRGDESEPLRTLRLNTLTYGTASLNITRPVICDSPKSIEMHVFSDASQVAYGSGVYMRSVAANGDITVKLLCSKSKVSPVKPTTIVRLELCAALLAARLSKAVLDSLRYKPDRVLYWSDSSIILAWLKNNITQLKSFVANRVTEILEITYPSTWRY